MNEQVLKILLQAKDLASGEIEKVKKAIDKVASASNEAGKKNKFFEDSLKNISDVAKTGAVVVGGLGLAFLGLGFSKAVEIQSAMADVQKSANLTSGEVGGLRDEILQLSKTTSTSNIELIGIAKIGGAINVAKDDLLAFTMAIDKVSVALGDEFSGGAEEVSTKLGTLRNLFKDTSGISYSDAMIKIGSAINTLGASGTATGPEVAEFANRIGQLGNMGPSITQTLGLGAAMQELGLSAEISSGGLTNIFLTAGNKSKVFAKQLGLSEIAFKNLYKASPNDMLLKLAGSFKKIADDPVALAKKMDELGLGSQEAIKVMSLLATKTDMVGEKQRIAAEEFGKATKESGSIIDEYNIKNNTLEAIFGKAKNTFEAFTTSIWNANLGGIGVLFQNLLTWVSQIDFTQFGNAINSIDWVGVSTAIGDVAKKMGDDLKPIVDDFLKNIWPVWEVHLQRIWEQMKVWLIPALKMLWSVFVNDLLPALINAIGTFLWLWDAVSPLIGLIGTLLVGAFGLIVSAIGLVIQNLTLIGKAAVQILTGDFKGAIDTVKNAWDNFIGFFTGGYGKISKMIGDIRGNMSGLKLPEFKIPGRASGGNVTAGQVYAVGENRDGSFNKTTELFVPNTSGKILNAKDTQAMVSGGGGNSGGGNTNNQNIVININAQGALLDDRTISEFARRTKNIFKAQGFQIS